MSVEMTGCIEPAAGYWSFSVFLGLSTCLYFKYGDLIDADEEFKILKGDPPITHAYLNIFRDFCPYLPE